ncbi:MAG: hypothetical protein ACRC4N_09815, partial [Gammaproteobacteria bacterium]
VRKSAVERFKPSPKQLIYYIAYPFFSGHPGFKTAQNVRHYFLGFFFLHLSLESCLSQANTGQSSTRNILVTLHLNHSTLHHAKKEQVIACQRRVAHGSRNSVKNSLTQM